MIRRAGLFRAGHTDGITSTIAATDSMFGSTDATGAAARFNFPARVSPIDGNANLYIADTNNATIRKITPGAVVTTIAGLAYKPAYRTGWPADARFKAPQALVAVGSNIDVADSGNDAIRLVTPAGAIAVVMTLVAGSSTCAARRAGRDLEWIPPATSTSAADSPSNTIPDIYDGLGP